MDKKTLIRAFRDLGIEERTPAVELAGSASGSGVFGVQVDGRDAVLKVTAAGDGQPEARRELHFYQALAGCVPVRTPALLDHVDGDLVVLLLSAHTATPPAREWNKNEWLQVVRQLAALHSTPVPEGTEWRRRQWLQDVLEHPRSEVADRYWSGTDAADGVRLILAETREMVRAIDAIPACFVHGDCHVGNLLRDGTEIVWSDWQTTGIGSPAADLAFLWGRADSDGADLPYEAMMEEYIAHRQLDPIPFRRALIATEIGFKLFGWPDWAHYHSPDECDRVTRRLIRLLEDWRDQP